MTIPASVPEKWLSLIGIGEDGVESLSPAARGLLAQARFVIGGARHLALAQLDASNGSGAATPETMVWPSPLTSALPAILARRGEPVCVLASGDPFFYGIGALLGAHVPPDEMRCLPAPSAFSLAAARLQWSLQDCRLVSLHGRAFETIIPELQPDARILCLAWDETTAPRLARLLSDRGFRQSRMIVLEAMGGARERIRSCAAEAFDLTDIAPLNLVAIEVRADAAARILPLGAALADAWFENDGQLTKREARAIALSALQPRRGELLWDVGSGSGSIAIEWLLRNPSGRAIAIEARKDRAERISRNARALGTPGLEIIADAAPAVFAALPRPQAIFVGGGGGDEALLDAAFAALVPGGRFVVNAVTLETEAVLISRYKALGGDLIKIEIARADPLGAFHGWRPAMPLTQWAVTKQ
ncbi:precorrin-6y C5,15-methyltransferase (decarboxylating) subunit CbiE [Methylocapsa palsarum]|uniref:Precorrin-6Y C5,15-methyltransferase (Decarboxylating) n=1 Tax=Methylocapsa palsarum TaxID=1612308 RepID=A0A1I4C0B0_9HYPH|nr:precorrin-6y C5,15-methyltransferase (decarboxylating) subunit CbiE [Methylocapsa palsarum]SFK73779.1 precorrin-6Y C5,15-methyltransferase (decarboxylating) [Methylocapsa palsarum]